MSELVKEFEELFGRKANEIETLKAHVADLEGNNSALYTRVGELEGRPYESLLEERNRFRAELEAEKANHQATAEQNEYLSRELQALRPKPVVVTHYDHIVDAGDCLAVDNRKEPNIKYTFSDGVLVSAEVIGGKK